MKRAASRRSAGLLDMDKIFGIQNIFMVLKSSYMSATSRCDDIAVIIWHQIASLTVGLSPLLS